MIVIVYGKANSGKNYYVNDFKSKDKIVIDEAHNFDFTNYKFLKDKDYFIIVQDLSLLKKSILNKSDVIIYCETKIIDDTLFYFIIKKINEVSDG